MSFEVDEDILQDFLVEASEILEQLSEQLVDLEKNPSDANLLNAIFRGFHTVKGGAGFLSLTELVDVCHGAENVFDILRNGKRSLTPELMDVILQALDNVNSMFAQVQNRQPLSPAPDDLIHDLHELCKPEGEERLSSTASAPAKSQEPAATVGVGADEISEDEFDSLLDALQGRAPKPAATNSDSISEDEFEALLDSLHGSEKPKPKTNPYDSDTITEDEFDALLDELQGIKKPNTTNSANEDATDDEFEALLDQLAEQNPMKGGKPNPLATVQSQVNDMITDEEFDNLLDQLQAKASDEAATTVASAAPKVAAPVVQAKPAAQIEEPKKEAVAPAKAAAPATPPAAPMEADTTVRVDTKTLDAIMNMVGELVLVRNRLVSLEAEVDNESVSKAVANLDIVTADLQGAVMKTRMQPIKKVFGRFPRVVRDLARTLKKDIDLVMIGEETDLDKNLVEALADPMVHLVRNSCDHGVELPEVREKAGKPRKGTITLSASQQGDHILLCIEDDGAGMDPEKLKSIAIKRGILDAETASKMTDNEAYNLIFAAGFSTKEVISDISGRGVGMDVVKTSIVGLNGSLHIDSSLGKGTKLEIKVPLTLAILPTLMVEVGKQIFALPLASVSEIFHLDLKKANMVDGQLSITVRNRAIPLFYLRSWLLKGNKGNQNPTQGHVVIVQLGGKMIALVVDGLIGQEEVVIKPLDGLLQGTPGMSGATITSDGQIALILDLPSLLRKYAIKKHNS